MSNKQILCDADGVLLNWAYAFHIWLDHHGHNPVVPDVGLFQRVSDQFNMENEKVMRLVKLFNESAAIGFLPAMRDAVQYVRLLHEEHGFTFHVISSVSDDLNVTNLRTMNLHKLFGAGAFEHIECLPIDASKCEYLSKFADSGCYWIEDSIQNAEDGLAFGLKPILLEHGFNLNYNNLLIPRVRSWKEIYELITIGSIQELDLTYAYSGTANKDD